MFGAFSTLCMKGLSETTVLCFWLGEYWSVWEPYQTSMIKLYCGIVNTFYAFAIFAKKALS